MRVIRAALSGCCVASLRGLSEGRMFRAGLVQSWGTKTKEGVQSGVQEKN